MSAELYLLGKGISAIGGILGGIGAQQEAKLNAFQMQTQKKENQIAAMQQARARQTRIRIFRLKSRIKW